MDYSV